MKKHILSVMGLALMRSATVLGQAPALPPGPPPMAVSFVNGHDCGHHNYECVPEHYIKVTKKVVFTSASEGLCLPPCCGLGLLHKCDGCGEAHCGHAYHVRYLIKKRQVCEEEAVKCLPVEAPGCVHGRCCPPPASCLTGHAAMGNPMPAPRLAMPSKY